MSVFPEAPVPEGNPGAVRRPGWQGILRVVKGNAGGIHGVDFVVRFPVGDEGNPGAVGRPGWVAVAGSVGPVFVLSSILLTQLVQKSLLAVWDYLDFESVQRNLLYNIA